MEYKQAILVRQDLKLPKGKMASQVAHASLDSAMKADKRMISAWRAEGMGKVVLKVADEKELRFFVEQAKEMDIAASIITDAGHTVVSPGTVTCAGIGPDKTEKIDSIVSKLKLV
jgi:PTH2 family peptidyl-tRNA hydrolase